LQTPFALMQQGYTTAILQVTLYTHLHNIAYSDLEYDRLANHQWHDYIPHNGSWDNMIIPL
jgi:hypothetical protein